MLSTGIFCAAQVGSNCLYEFTSAEYSAPGQVGVAVGGAVGDGVGEGVIVGDVLGDIVGEVVIVGGIVGEFEVGIGVVIEGVKFGVTVTR